MRKQTILVLIVAVMWVFLTNTAFAEILQYEIIDLGSLGGGWSVPNAINEAGQVVGCSNTISGFGHAFLWDEGEMTDLGTLGGGYDSSANGINDAGQVVGHSGSDDGSAFIWDSTNGMRYLDGIGDTESEARDINNSGQVVGSIYGYPGFGFLWDNGQMTDLESGTPFGINNASQVVGGDPHAFLWDDGDTIDMGTLGGSFSRAYAINEAGQVIGYADSAGGDEHAFLWEDGEMIDLGTFGGSNSRANDINNAGQIVGHSYLDPPSIGYRAFLWDSENGMIELSDLLFDSSGWERLTYAMAINNYGQIVGQGITAGGETHAFLMTPVPEPATLLLVALGSLALRRKNK